MCPDRKVNRSVPPMRTLILCGGVGSRAYPHTLEVPKPLLEVAGRPVLHHLLDLFAAQGRTDFVLAAGYKADHIEAFAATLPTPDETLYIAVRDERDQPVMQPANFWHAGEFGDWIGVEADAADALARDYAGTGIHVIDAMIGLAGPIAEVQAQSYRLVHTIAFDDTTTMLFRLAGGATGHLAAPTATASFSPAISTPAATSTCA